MNEQSSNPFEQVMSSGQLGNPFAPLIADPFGKETQDQAAVPSLDLGNQADAQNPFDDPPVSDAPNQLITSSEYPAPAPSAPETAVTAATVKNAQSPASPQATDNPLETAMQKSIFAKPPVFEHGAVKEPVENLNQTFDDLRIAKADDFPELEDGVRVSWDVIYGKIRKSVPAPKKTKIGEFKRAVESSKEFLDSLKKEKDKSPDCIIKPRITAQSKGESLSVYKGVFRSLETAYGSDKVICIVPGRDGSVYELRKEEAGTFITPSGECRELSEVSAGFIPALPLIPCGELRSIIGFFRSLMQDGKNYEAIANIYWDRWLDAFHTVIPIQHVSPVRADSDLTPGEYDPARYLHYMDVHSHNVMPAVFSQRDDKDEKATRLYTVIGRLGRYIPEITVRISNGGKFLSIDPSVVFESLSAIYPEEWNGRVTNCETGQKHLGVPTARKCA